MRVGDHHDPLCPRYLSQHHQIILNDGEYGGLANTHFGIEKKRDWIQQDSFSQISTRSSTPNIPSKFPFADSDRLMQNSLEKLVDKMTDDHFFLKLKELNGGTSSTAVAHSSSSSGSSSNAIHVQGCDQMQDALHKLIGRLGDDNFIRKFQEANQSTSVPVCGSCLEADSIEESKRKAQCHHCQAECKTTRGVGDREVSERIDSIEASVGKVVDTVFDKKLEHITRNIMNKSLRLDIEAV